MIFLQEDFSYPAIIHCIYIHLEMKYICYSKGNRLISNQLSFILNWFILYVLQRTIVLQLQVNVGNYPIIILQAILVQSKQQSHVRKFFLLTTVDHEDLRADPILSQNSDPILSQNSDPILSQNSDPILSQNSDPIFMRNVSGSGSATLLQLIQHPCSCNKRGPSCQETGSCFFWRGGSRTGVSQNRSRFAIIILGAKAAIIYLLTDVDLEDLKQNPVTDSIEVLIRQCILVKPQSYRAGINLRNCVKHLYLQNSLKCLQICKDVHSPVLHQVYQQQQ